MPCPYSIPITDATQLRMCQFGGPCGVRAWEQQYLNCIEYKRQKEKERQQILEQKNKSIINQP